VTDSLTNDGELHEHTILRETLVLTILSASFEDGLNDGTTFLVDVSEQVHCVVKMLTSDKIGYGIQFPC
jgi:hypothetical protein